MIGDRIGISITAVAVYAVRVRRRKIVAVASCGYGSPSDLARALRDAVRGLATGRGFSRPDTIVSVSSQWAQVKRIPGDNDANGYAADVAKNPRRYFLAGECEPLVTGPSATSEGASLFAAFDRAACSSLETACREAQLRLIGVVPEPAARGLADSEVAQADGDFAAAAGAAVATRKRVPLMLSVSRLLDRGEPPVPRVLLAGLAFFLATATALVAPGLAAQRSAAAHAQETMRLAPDVRAMARQRASFDSVTRILAEAEVLLRRRRSMTTALAALTRSLPIEAYASDIRLDSMGGTLVIVGRRAATIVEALEASDLFSGVTLIGALTPQPSASGLRERMTVRFRWKS